jgi:hypothetical protein
MKRIAPDHWLLPVCAYVPQSAWLLNASIQDKYVLLLTLVVLSAAAA